MSLTREEAVAAFLKDPASVQMALHDGSWIRPAWRHLDPDIDWCQNEFRLTPRPVPPGDLTWEEAKAAHQRGECVEFLSPHQVLVGQHLWDVVHRWFDGATEETVKASAYRLRPAPKTVPLGPEDVPPGSVVRHVTWTKHAWAPCNTVPSDGVQVMAQPSDPDKELIYLSYEDLTHGWQISRDGGKTWSKCHKEVAP